MIKNLALTNFKSIGKTLIANDEEITEGKLDFAPLTIFCGKNSSGKSTVLQSILLLAQTLQNNVPKQTLVLNGPMVKLGGVNDIKSEFLNSKNITFDIDLILSGNIQEYHNECIEEFIFVEGYGKLKYFLSNNLYDIEKAIFSISGFTHNLSNAIWQKNPNLSINVRKIMDKHKLVYSMTTYYHQGIRQLVVNKHFENDWLISSFTEFSHHFYPTKHDNLEAFDPSKISFIRENIINETKYNINLRILFCNKKQNDISNIIPLIKQIYINTGTINFTATKFRNKLKNFYTLFNALHSFDSFEYYNIYFDNNTRKDIEKITNYVKLIGLNLNHFIPERIWCEENIIKEYTDGFIKT
jgi:hypothetical protein